MARSKLKSALDNHKGRNIKLEKQRKHEKEVHKRKEANKPEGEEDDSAEEGGVQLDDVAEVKTNGKTKKSKANGVKAAAAKDEPEWETDASEDEDESDDDDDMAERPALDLSHLDDSESDVSGDDEEPEEILGIHADEDDEDEDEDEEEEEDDDDIPLSDIESLASEDRGDIIPHQRLTINNTTALTAALKRIQLPYSKLAFSEHMAVVTDEPVDIPDVEDDLNRELAFYKQSLSSVKDARAKLKKEGAPFSRPADYFAEMVKSDEHMGKIKKKLVDDAAGKKAAAEARKQRDLKKFGKQVQVAKMQERAKEKKDTMEKIKDLKRSMFSSTNYVCYVAY
jgi:rRNA-processing protein EBP2